MITMYKEQNFLADLPRVVQRLRELNVGSVTCASCCFPVTWGKRVADELGVPFVASCEQNTLELRLSVTDKDTVPHTRVFAFYASSRRAQHVKAFYKTNERAVPFME